MSLEKGRLKGGWKEVGIARREGREKALRPDPEGRDLKKGRT